MKIAAPASPFESRFLPYAIAIFESAGFSVYARSNHWLAFPPAVSVSSASCKNDCDAIMCSPSSAANSATRK
jgi:hypothetical protein